jgi:hypothetical protein
MFHNHKETTTTRIKIIQTALFSSLKEWKGLKSIPQQILTQSKIG